MHSWIFPLEILFDIAVLADGLGHLTKLKNRNMCFYFERQRWLFPCTSLTKSENFLEWTDRWTAWEHTSLAGFRELRWWSLSACGTELLCIPVARQQKQQIQVAAGWTGCWYVFQNLMAIAQTPHLSGSIQIILQIAQTDWLETFLDRMKQNFRLTLDFACNPSLFSSWHAIMGG